MHPAPSIILFTVASGLGYGLAVMLGLGLLDPQALATKIAHVLSLALIGGGLMSSTLHLGNPRRAWRALSQWRSSWLSREGVMALATFVPLTISAALALFADRFSLPLGLLCAAMAVATVYCTAMIYASLKAVEAWHTPLTPACYVAFSLAGGALLASLFAAIAGSDPRLPALVALLLLAIAWGTKRFWTRRMLALVSPSTPETATGLGSIGKVRLLERPHMTENYLTREMGFKVARKHAEKLWRIAVGLGGLAPAAALLVLLAGQEGWLAVAAAALACLAFVTGLLIERWLFFAEARHAVMNYYGG
jgi:DMSO reductase anchor subunit